MCMLCVIPPGVIPSREKLENSALNNPHGFGFAIVVPDEDRIIRERTMDPDSSINRFLALREQYQDGYAMWHARLATHGSKTKENCHPFYVGKDKRTMLAHNGILDIEIKKGDDRSDTRVFAEDLIPAIGGIKALDNPLVWDMLEDYATGSKICILTVDPEANHQCYLLNENLGKADEDGVWWSNDSCYLTTVNKVSNPYLTGWGGHYGNGYVYDADDEEVVWTCPDPACNSTLTYEEVDMYDFTCHYCGACIDCQSSFADCQCYRKYGYHPAKYASSKVKGEAIEF